MTTLSGLLRRALLAGLAGLSLSASAQQRFDERIDALLRLGHDRPDAALAELRTLQPPAEDIDAQRLLLLARGMVLAQSDLQRSRGQDLGTVLLVKIFP